MHRVAVSALLLTALCTAPAAAAPTVVSQKGFLVQQFDIAGGGATRSATVWSGFRRSARRTSRGVYGRVATGTVLRRIQRLDSRGSDPHVAVGPDGSAVGGLGTRLGAAPRLGAGGPLVRTRAHAVAGDRERRCRRRGDLLGRSHGRRVAGKCTEVLVSIRRSGRFGTPLSLGSSRFAPSIAAATNGQIVVTWATFPGAFGPYGIGSQVMAAVLAPRGSAFGAPTALDPRVQGEFPDAFGGRGGALVAWTRAPDRFVRRLAPDGSFGPALRLSPGVVGDVEFAVPVERGAVAIWSRGQDSARPVVEAAVEQAGGTFPRRACSPIRAMTPRTSRPAISATARCWPGRSSDRAPAPAARGDPRSHGLVERHHPLHRPRGRRRADRDGHAWSGAGVGRARARIAWPPAPAAVALRAARRRGRSAARARRPPSCGPRSTRVHRPRAGRTACRRRRSRD